PILVHDAPLLSCPRFDQPRRPVAKGRVHVIVPEIERLKDVTVGVDDVVGAAHQGSSTGGKVKLRHPSPAAVAAEAECRSECRTRQIAPPPPWREREGPIATRWEGEGLSSCDTLTRLRAPRSVTLSR